MKTILNAAVAAVVLALVANVANAGSVSAWYGDDDGFGVGVTSGTMDPDTSNQEPGEDAYTDQRLISDIYETPEGYPAFKPTGGFSYVMPSGAITSATFTLRAGSWETTGALDAPNRLFLDGMAIPSSFFDVFVQLDDFVEEHTLVLDASFFATLSDGAVSLNGTHLSERQGAGSFQIDFLRLDIVTEAVPLPSAAWMGLGLLGGAGIAARLRRRKVTAIV